MDNFLKNKEVFLEEVYPNLETRRSMISNYSSNILYLEKLLNKDLMYFTSEEVESLLLNANGISKGYKSSLYSFINSYCEWCIDNGYININPLSSISASEVIEVNIKQLMKGYMGLNQFYNALRLLESKSTILSSTMLALLLARNGVVGKKMCDLINLEEQDIDLKNGFVNIYCKTNNHEDYGLQLTSLPLIPEFEDWYNKLIAIKSYNSLGTRKNNLITYINSPYILKRTNYTNTADDIRVSPNTVLNQINQCCISAGISRISLSKLQQSYKLDMLLGIRKKRRINEYDIKDIIKLVNYNFTSAQSVINFKQFYENISGEEVLKGNKIEFDNGEEFIKNLRIRINYF